MRRIRRELEREDAPWARRRTVREFRGGGGSGGGGSSSNQVKAIATKTADYTATSSDEVLLFDCTSGNKTLTLPAAASSTRLRLVVKKIDSSVNTLTIDANGAETIDGATTLVLASQYTSYTLVCDGTTWHVI